MIQFILTVEKVIITIVWLIAHGLLSTQRSKILNNLLNILTHMNHIFTSKKTMKNIEKKKFQWATKSNAKFFWSKVGGLKLSTYQQLATMELF